MRSMLDRIIQASSQRVAATNGTVEVFLVLLSSKITQADMADKKRAQKPGSRSYHNPNAMGMMLERAKQVGDRMKPYLRRDDHEAIQMLRADILKSFHEIPPIRATIKQIDAYLKDGKLPNLVRK